MMRQQVRKEYTWTGSGWLLTNEVRYVYDGRLVLQERDGNNLSRLTYTRGNDLSGLAQPAPNPAGGIDDLLARTDNGQLIAGSASAHAYYHADGNGNITALVSTNGLLVARYHNDPYGNTPTISGPKAFANCYRFSSKPVHAPSGMYDYLYRWYAPELQRFVNRDLIGELGGINLYFYVGNNPVILVDPFGLEFRVSFGISGTVGFGGYAGGGASIGLSIGKTDIVKPYLQFEAVGMGGIVPLPFAGVGFSLGVERGAKPLPASGYEMCRDIHTEANIGGGPEIGITVQGDPKDPTGISIGVLPKFGVGVGAMVGTGIAQNVTLTFPRFSSSSPPVNTIVVPAGFNTVVNTPHLYMP